MASDYQKARTFTSSHPVGLGCILALIVELITVLFRFGLKMQSTVETSWMARYTFGLRIHHGYIGLLLILIFFMLLKRSKRFRWLYSCGIALLLSDIIHHFLVLWIITGSHDFDLVYPG